MRQMLTPLQHTQLYKETHTHIEESYDLIQCGFARIFQKHTQLGEVLDLTVEESETQTEHTHMHTQQSAHIADCHIGRGTVINTIH